MSSSASLSLGIDGGASSAKWSLINTNSEILLQGKHQPIDGHLYRAESLERFTSFITTLKNDLGNLVPDVVTLGITGFGAGDKLREELSKAFPQAKLNLGNDVALAYHSAFEPGEGVYLYAGTGSIAVHIDKSENEILVGGWGYLLGDEGGGYWIGRESVRHLLSQIESYEQLDDLSIRIAGELGGANWESIRSFVYSKDRSAIAALTPHVTASAAQNCSSALQILESAAHHLSQLVGRIREILKNQRLPLVFGGGIADTKVRDFLEKELGEDIPLNKADHSITAAKLGIKNRHDHP